MASQKSAGNIKVGMHLLREHLLLSRHEEVKPTVNAAMFINRAGRDTKDSLASMLAFFCMGTSTLYSRGYSTVGPRVRSGPPRSVKWPAKILKR